LDILLRSDVEEIDNLVIESIIHNRSTVFDKKAGVANGARRPFIRQI